MPRASFSPQDITIATVTYGRRSSLLLRTLAAARREGICRAALLDNGSLFPAEKTARKFWAASGGSFFAAQRSETNMGSTAGYRAVLKLACASPETSLILLVDDDNALLPGCAGKLCDAVNASSLPQEDTAFFACREGRPLRRLLSPLLKYNCEMLPILPLKVKTMLGRLRRAIKSPIAEPACVDLGPYGGMLFHRALPDKHGYPGQCRPSACSKIPGACKRPCGASGAPDFVLYADDYEFTFRIRAGGGYLQPVPEARIEDIGPQTQAVPHRATVIRRYYRIRNNAYLETHCFPYNRAIRLINRTAYWLGRWWKMKSDADREEWRFLRRAMADGEAGRLGENPDFPLSGLI